MLQDAVEPILAKHGHPMRLVRRGSLFWFSPGSSQPPARADLIPSTAGALYSDVHKGLLEKGYMLAPSAYESVLLQRFMRNNTFLVWPKPWTKYWKSWSGRDERQGANSFGTKPATCR